MFAKISLTSSRSAASFARLRCAYGPAAFAKRFAK
jgi:hypothetical protein